MFQLDFAFFPQDAIEVQAYVNFDCSTLPESEYLIRRDLVRQQCMGFVNEE